MTQEEKIQYMANLFHFAQVDGKQDAIEEKLIDGMAKGISAGYFETIKGKDLASQAGFTIQYPSRFSERVRNIEDMLLLAHSDRKLHELEKTILLDYAESLHLTQKQSDLIREETKAELAKVKKR